MQYRGKNQMSPDLFSLVDSLTQKLGNGFLTFSFDSGNHLELLDKIPSLKNL